MAKGWLPRRSVGAWLIVGMVASAGAGIEGQRAGQGGVAARPDIPSDLAQFWLVPSKPAAPSLTRPAADFAAGLRFLAQDNPARALPLFESAALARSPLAAYATFYRGLCLMALARPAEARTLFSRLHGSADIVGFVADASIGHEAEAATAAGDHAGAVRLYDEWLARKPAGAGTVLLALGRELAAAGDRARAADVFSRLYFEFPMSDQAADAAAELDKLQDVQPARSAQARAELDFTRAEQLFAARRYSDAKQAFEPLEPVVTGGVEEIVELRLAECDYFLRRYRPSRDRLAALLDHASRPAEVGFFLLSATRELGDQDEYLRRACELISTYPDSSWAEETLNNLATHFILTDKDDQADAVFRELYAKFPKGPHAERAAWRAGWWAYTHAHPEDAITFFDGAAAAFPRSDYRPAYLYWSARSREQLGDTEGAALVYRLVMSDYLNSYYGRLAAKRPAAAGGGSSGGAATGGAAAATARAIAPPPNAGVIRMLVSAGLYEQARDELLCAQQAWGDTPMIGATLGWVDNKLGDYRLGIIAMKRAYPQYIGEGGARMPVEALKVIFPLDYWPLIRKYAAVYHLDPYLIAALINQESAFDARIKSSAGAIGLMQVLPSTGRQYARTLHIRHFSTASLTRPEINIQIGLAYFADVVGRAGGIHLALAGYNAGERRVREWNEERPGLDRDEYIDAIPFPETQGYVKKIIGTTEDYRRLYASGAAPAPKPAARKSAPKTIKK